MAIPQRQCEAVVGLANRRSTTGQSNPAADHELLLQVARLARRGRYDAAVAMLAPLPADSPLRPSILDLKAKIFAQQGRYWEAEGCWREALTLAPDTQAFQQALAVIAEERRCPFWLRIAVVGTVAAATSMAGVAVLLAVLKWAGWLGR
jgi:type VI secretion system protein ImpK